MHFQGVGWVLDTFSGCWMGIGCITKVLDRVLDAFLGCWMDFQGVGWGVGCLVFIVLSNTFSWCWMGVGWVLGQSISESR